MWEIENDQMILNKILWYKQVDLETANKKFLEVLKEINFQIKKWCNKKILSNLVLQNKISSIEIWVKYLDSKVTL